MQMTFSCLRRGGSKELVKVRRPFYIYLCFNCSKNFVDYIFVCIVNLNLIPHYFFFPPYFAHCVRHIFEILSFVLCL